MLSIKPAAVGCSMCGLTLPQVVYFRKLQGEGDEKRGGKQNDLGSTACSDGTSCQSSVLDRSTTAKSSEFLASPILISPHWECMNSSSLGMHEQ